MGHANSEFVRNTFARYLQEACTSHDGSFTIHKWIFQYYFEVLMPDMF